MANIMDYLDWRGDLSFQRAPFSEVDNLILSKLVCIPLEGIVPPPGAGAITVREAAARYFACHGEGESLGVLMAPELLPMFRRLAVCPRFAGLSLSDLVSRVDEAREEQFAAMAVTLPDATRYAAFRGTDDNIVAWKEDFNMAFLEVVPSQAAALDYLRALACTGPQPLRVGGHSKGGNLAVYAAMHSPPELQARLLHIYSNDGPGFRESVMEQPGFRRVQDRILTLVPQGSLVGMLLAHSEEYEVVRSTKSGGLSQHNGFTWQLLGSSFVRCAALDASGRLNERSFRAWMDELPLEKRREFVDALFEALTATGARTLTELNEVSLRQALELPRHWKGLAPELQRLLTDTLGLLLREYLRAVGAALPRPRALREALLRGRQESDTQEEAGRP